VIDAAHPLDHRSPISDYAIIGDTRSAALISRDGSIDWLCWPRFDSPSVFARLLDPNGGHFSICPEGAFEAKRRYIDATNVLETTFTTATGVARLVDLMPVMSEEEKLHRLTPFRELLRRIEVVEGEVTIVVDYAPRPDYARAKPRFEQRGDCLYCVDRADVFILRTDATESRFTLRAGERRDFALSFDSHSPAVHPHIGDEATHAIARSLAFWREWSSHCEYDGPYRDAVQRSALVLKLLTYAPSGAIVASPTTSLPESLGGPRNWDYRYCWLRDAAFTVAALDDLGFTIEGGAFVSWLLYATRLTHPSLQILYDVFGESQVPERTLDHLVGYANSRPVRIGNAARDQFQLDVYGEVLGAVDEHLSRGERIESDVKKVVSRLARTVVKRWREPDSGIWEKRNGLQQHVHAKVMAWAALDCAIRLTGDESLRATQDEIRALVLEHGFDAQRNSFVATLDDHELDASLLSLSRVSFLPGDDPRILGTIDAIRRELGHDELVYRYKSDDGLEGGEGAFLACSFWLVEALVHAGRIDEACDVFEKLLRRANDVGLYSEEIDIATGAFLGNFPQALTHIGLVNAALCLNDADKTRRESHRTPRARRS